VRVASGLDIGGCPSDNLAVLEDVFAAANPPYGKLMSIWNTFCYTDVAELAVTASHSLLPGLEILHGGGDII
jgi:hypothetical protein